MDDFGWSLLANAGAYSDTHIDAGGYCTYMRCLLGSKLWLVAKDPQDFQKNPQSITEYVNSAEGWVEEKLEWEYVFLGVGDEL